jgi:hypothetical protein
MNGVTYRMGVAFDDSHQVNVVILETKNYLFVGGNGFFLFMDLLI